MLPKVSRILIPLLVFFLISSSLFSQTTCALAVTLTPGSTCSPTLGNLNTGTTSNAPASNCPSATAGSGTYGLWYKFVATSTNPVITVTIPTGSGLFASTTYMEVTTSCGGATTYCQDITSSLFTSGLTVTSTYYIRVYVLSGSTPTGNLSFNICVQNQQPPANDDCAGAILLPTARAAINSKGILDNATASAGIPIGTCAATTPNHDVWFKFVASTTNPTISLSSISANLKSSQATMQVFSGTCASLTSIACATTTVGGTTLNINTFTPASLTVGSTYYVRVFNKSGTALTSATFNICVTDPTAAVVDSTSTIFNIDTIARKLGYPWEITLGPDDSLWVTEAQGYRVLRMKSTRTATEYNVAPQQILKIPLGSSQVTFDRSIGIWPQGGMEGLAIHPDFSTGFSKQLVYLAYVYTGACPSGTPNPCIFRSKIVQCQFYYASDAGNPSLTTPKHDSLVIIDTVYSNLSGSNDHNSARMKISPVKEGPDNTYKLYYTIGDMGAGQFNNATRTNNAQNPDTCEGKILRFNTEKDADTDPSSPIHDYDRFRRWIPNDNPFTHSINGLRTPVYSYGHRNAQGLVWGNVNGTWRLYSSEHGDRSDDEVNIIKSGMNYGWPKVTGMADDNYNTFDDASNGYILNNILANKTVTDETTFASATPNYQNPIFDFFNWSAAQIETINTGNIFTWPTIAPSSIDIYTSGQIPGWQNSLLVTSLKYGVYRLKLNATGDAIDSTVCTNLVDTIPLLHGWRVRDIAISQNGGTIWAAIDSSGSTSGPTGGFSGGNATTTNGGTILRFTVKNFITLPVGFNSFTGRLLQDQTVRLDWAVAQDENFSYFIIERANGVNDFKAIGKISGSPPYSFIDYAPEFGNNYYRIKAVEKSGKFNYSKIIVIDVENQMALTYFPNPVKDLLTLRITSRNNDKVIIQLCDLQGKIVSQQTRMLSQGTNEAIINTRNLTSGVYILKVATLYGQTLTNQKIIKY